MSRGVDMKISTSKTKQQQSQETIGVLLTVAMEEFSQYGYSGASTERIVKKAQLTRGALYHHFANKKDLFYSVFLMAQREIAKRIEDSARQATEPWEELLLGCYGFLEATSDPALQQIVVRDGPAVLDWESYRLVAEEGDGGVTLLAQCLKELSEKKIISAEPIEAMTHLLSGAMDEAAVWVAQADDSGKALGEAKEALSRLLQGLRC